jgi:hypothetical protein
MKFFQVKSDPAWELARGVECSACSTWEMPAMQCPAGCRLLPTRNPGFCYPAADFSSDLFLWRALERGSMPKPLGEVQWHAQWREAKKWKELHDRVLSVLPYPVPITPGTCFGVSLVRLSGRPADWHWDLDSGHVFIAGRALNQLQTNGIADLFAIPCFLKPNRQKTYFELQIEHCAELNAELSTNRRPSLTLATRKCNCGVCGRHSGLLPKHPVLRGETIPAGVSLFRLKESPLSVFCTEAFRDAAIRLNLTNLAFLQIDTDGSEKQRGFARVATAKPAFWVPQKEVPSLQFRPSSAARLLA